MRSGDGLRLVLGGALVLLGLALTPIATAATVPYGFAATVVSDELSKRSTAMAFAPDGRVFVADQDGNLSVIKNGALLSTPFVTLDVNGDGERGLLGVAVDPEFTTNQWIYVYYTARTPYIHNRVSRFTASGDLAVAGSELVIFDLPGLTAQNHNGGAIHFGPDGKLYVAVGDNAKSSNSQSLTTVLGKILRIGKDGSIPSDNPFYGTTTGENRAIWALGVRNPFTFSFQPGPGRMHINDVGQGAWEEINEGIAGSNYGWPEVEGPSTDPRFRPPVFAYAHGNTSTTGCAVTGGAFYNPPTPQFPASYVGNYFFADYCGGWIRKLDPDGYTVTDFATGVPQPVDIAVGPDSALYVLARYSANGQLYRISYTGSLAPTIEMQPASQTVSVGGEATFTVSAGGRAPLSYQWQRNGLNIFGATSSTYTIPNAQQSDDGAQFRVRVTNDAGTATSDDAVLTVTSNRPPTATIDVPAVGTLYGGGQTIAYGGSGTDPEDGTLASSRFAWLIDFHHADHIHPFLPSTSGSTGGSFTVPTSGHPESDVWFRIHLTVTDSGGMTASTFRDVDPRLVPVDLVTTPSGLQLRLDGQPINAPYSFTGVVGVERALEAPSPQSANDTTWQFQSWSNGGARAQTISTPGVGTTYTAAYESAPTSSFRANINFQPASAPGVSGYLVDAGAVYGARGNGNMYGWNANTSRAAWDRNAKNVPDQRYDTLIQMQHHTNPNASWEIAVPNGSYTVHVVAGDPSAHNSVYEIAVEGVLTVDGTPNATSRWREGTSTVTVTDGRLTIANGAGATNNKICFVEIAAA